MGLTAKRWLNTAWGLQPQVKKVLVDDVQAAKRRRRFIFGRMWNGLVWSTQFTRCR